MQGISANGLVSAPAQQTLKDRVNRLDPNEYERQREPPPVGARGGSDERDDANGGSGGRGR